MATQRASNGPLSQSLPWLIAAALVFLISLFVMLWMNATAVTADSDRLDRGADAVQSAIEEQVKVLQLAGTGTASMVGTPMTEFDLESVVRRMDVTLLRSMLAAIVYPVGPESAEPGTFIAPGLIQVRDLEVPSIEVSRAEVEELVSAGDVYLSPPLHTKDPERFDYIMGIPDGSGEDLRLIAVLFRPDRMLSGAVDATGGDQYAVTLVDARLDDQRIVSLGEPSSDMKERRQPAGLQGALQIEVAPGERFPFSASAWMPQTVVIGGLVIAALLVWMGSMARARARDFAERLRLAQELSEGKDRFLATVSHELRTPLTVILGVSAEAGGRWDELDPRHRAELLAMMSEQAQEASHIVEDLLVASRSDPAKLRLAIESTELSPHVEYALASLPRDSLSRIRWDRSPQIVYADGTRLRQILRNVLENAVKYGGPDIGIHSWEADGYVRIEIRDNGPGVAAADLDRIFEPYEQSTDASPESPTGVGIGLYVSRLLARLMGGDLECTRTANETNFRLVIPIGYPDATMEQEEVVPSAEASAAS
ncbi:MAG: HAMP domain-containing sensor histidine kinase [Acidimicrobiia bacterium]|nr:HAMP domain-containing sensor histidine kinase [Acidimicrobiia bacterium]